MGIGLFAGFHDPGEGSFNIGDFSVQCLHVDVSIIESHHINVLRGLLRPGNPVSNVYICRTTTFAAVE
jgi:hypothetical protein